MRGVRTDAPGFVRDSNSIDPGASQNMRTLLISRTWAAGVLLVMLAVSAELRPRMGKYFSPLLKPETRPLTLLEANRVLAAFCRTAVHDVSAVGPTCETRQSLGPEFSDIVDHTFHPRGIMFGSFLAPDSDDVAVSGWSAETHPGRWGGSLLLTRRNGSWVPLWYRSALIIDSCEKVVLPSRRQILLCEDEDSGMGHSFHYLYSVDFGHPSDWEHSLLTKAESFRDDCVYQKQLLRGLRWDTDRRVFSALLLTQEWKRLSDEPYCADYPWQAPKSVRLSFSVVKEGVRRVTDERLGGK